MAEPKLDVATGYPHERGVIRLSLDLHDGPMQDLAAVGFAFDRLRRELETLPGDTSTLLMQVDGIREQLAVIELSLRHVVETTANGSPRSTLASLIHDEVARFTRLDDATVELHVDESVEPATDSQLIALHRVLREALTNVHKHADAGLVEIRVYESGDVIHLEVTDDGAGFDASQRPPGGGLGLDGMRERLRLLGSELRVSTQPGGPTTIAAAVRRWRPA
jgi:signal transduction histidine kinase